MKPKTAFPMALALALMLAPAALAQPSGRPMGPGPGGPGPGPGRGPNLERMTQQLDLTDQQRDQIREILDNHRDGAQKLDQEMRAARDTLHDAIHAEVFDETAIRDAAAAVSLLEADRAVDMARTLSQVRQVLTPEQREKLAEMQQTRREHRQDRMHDRMMWHRQGSPPDDNR